MSINGVFLQSNFYVSQQQMLSEETKRKLQALGIDPSTVTSETQAKALIAAIEENIEVQKTTNESSSKNTCSMGERELVAKAQSLAKELDVKIASTDSIENILNNICTKITTLASQSDDDKISEYKNDYEKLESDFSIIKENQNSLTNSMNFAANVNKYLLGINVKR